MKDEEVMVICSDKGRELVSSIDVICHKCGVNLVLADSTMGNLKKQHPERDFAENPPVISCIDCIPKEAKDNLVEVFLNTLKNLTDEQKLEILKSLK